MPESCDAVVAGHLCLDVIPDLSAVSPEQFQQSFKPGRLMVVGGVSFSTGGPVSNVGLALHRLGVKTRLMGKVGDDLFGHAILELAAAYDPALIEGMVVDPTVSSSYTIIVNPPDRDRMFLHCPGANDAFSAADIRYDSLQDARLFHFGYPPLMRLMYENKGRELAEIYRRAKETGVTTSLDMALPDPASAAGRAAWPAILAATLPHVDVFLPSIEEILYMLQRDIYNELYDAAREHDILPLITPELLADISARLLAMGPKVVGLKLGHRGFYLRTGDEAGMRTLGRARPTDAAAWAHKELWAPCFKAQFVGAAGSGDATIAGFLSALLRDYSPEEAVTAAVAVGGCNVEAADTLSSLRGWEETMARIAAGWERHPLDIEAPGWVWNDRWRLWTGPGAVSK